MGHLHRPTMIDTCVSYSSEARTTVPLRDKRPVLHFSTHSIGERRRIYLPRTRVHRAREPLSPPHLPARASHQGVWVELELLAQLPALAEQRLHPGHPSPRLLRLLAHPRPQREELPGLFGAPYQNEGLGPFCVIQRPFYEGGPPLDEL